MFFESFPLIFSIYVVGLYIQRNCEKALHDPVSWLRYIICALDTTVFPANGPHLQAAVQTLTTLLSSSSTMIGFVLYPQFQSQTSHAALVKHKHLLDNSLMKGGVTLINTVQILFSKPDSTTRDTRPLCQPAMAVFHTHFGTHVCQQKSAAVRQGKVGPCPLLRIGDFVGYDGDLSKPGASARVEQTLGFRFRNSCLNGLPGLQILEKLSLVETWL